MGDSPGTALAESMPEASQPSMLSSTAAHVDKLPPPSTEPSKDLPPSQHQLIQSKRSSLPPRPHAAARHTKRLTLNFPINVPLGPPTFDPSASSSPSGAMTPVTRSSARQSPVHSISTPVPFDGQDDGSGLLTAIASQERKVLELREELGRAEAELDSLKKQWASSEKTRKRTEINHRAEPLLPLKSPDLASGENSTATSHNREDSVGGSTPASPAVAPPVRVSRELDRRQSVRVAATNGTTISANGRRVFQGSHARTLSLLSPAPGSTSSKQSGSASGTQSPMDSERLGRPPRSATMPSVDRSPIATSPGQVTDDMISQWRKTMPPPSREMLMRTGKQMASDLREGLWTFLEDIRQATVGDEGINATESRTMQPPRKRDSSSTSTSQSRDRLSVQGGKPSRSPSTGSRRSGTKTTGKDSKPADIDASFWSEFGIDSPGQKAPNTHRASQPASGPKGAESPNPREVEDNWDEWDTPQPKKTHTPSSSRSTIESKHDQSPTTQTSSPRTSTSFGDWNHEAFVPDPSVSEGIPWPAITKLTPSKLTRTASNLMAEWERSLASSPEPKSPLGTTADKDDKKD